MKLKIYAKRSFTAIMATCAVSCSVFAATPTEIYQSAVSNMAAHPDGVYTVHVDTQIPFALDSALNQTISVQMVPFRVKGHTDIASAGMAEFFGRADIYAEQNGDILNCYYRKNDDAWKAGEEKLKDATPLAEKTVKRTVSVAYLKSVTKVADNTYAVTVDPAMLDIGAIMRDIRAKKGDDKNLKDIEGVLNAVKQSGPVTATVMIDPSRNKITHFEMPLTGQLRSLLTYAVVSSDGMMTPAEQAIAQQVADNSTVNLTLDYAELPEGIDLTVPQYVKDQVLARDKHGTGKTVNAAFEKHRNGTGETK